MINSAAHPTAGIVGDHTKHTFAASIPRGSPWPALAAHPTAGIVGDHIRHNTLLPQFREDLHDLLWLLLQLQAL